MTLQEYKAAFAEPKQDGSAKTEADTRAGRALAVALDTRKFEIDLYWKRATYFWAFIAAAFAGYAATRNSADHEWLGLLFSAFGLVFGFGWFLVNKGSKFWQENWEKHVDCLEEMTMGPLFKLVIVEDEHNRFTRFFTGAGQFSVSKVNQLLSLFVTCVWLLLFVKSFVGPIPSNLEIDVFKAAIVVVTFAAVIILAYEGRSDLRRHQLVSASELQEPKAPKP